MERSTTGSTVYKEYVDIIVSKCPGLYEIVPAEGNMDINMHKLADLHYKIMCDNHAVKMYSTYVFSLFPLPLSLHCEYSSCGKDVRACCRTRIDCGRNLHLQTIIKGVENKMGRESRKNVQISQICRCFGFVSFSFVFPNSIF